MPVESPAPDWYKKFFAGAALRLWRAAGAEEPIDEQVAFLLEMLDVPEGSSILDVPSGNGRLSLPLAAAGYAVTGVDYASEYVAEAKKAASAASAATAASAASALKKLQFIQGDMLELALGKKFDGAICMGNSFGYFERHGTEKFLHAVAAHLKPGAKFVLDTLMIAECFLVNGGEREWVKVGDMYMLIENQYDFQNSCVKTEYTFIEDGVIEKRHAVHWIYTTGELCSMLTKAGFGQFELFGSTDAEPFALGADRLLVVAVKA